MFKYRYCFTINKKSLEKVGVSPKKSLEKVGVLSKKSLEKYNFINYNANKIIKRGCLC